MKAIVVHQYGGPEVLKFEDYPDPVPGPGEVLVRVAAASVNPIDYKRRAGLTKDFYPMQFPGLIGVDMAGTVVKIGPGVEGFSVGDQVFAMADNTYAELCVVSGGLGEGSQGARFDPGGGAAAGDDDRQPAPFRYGNQSGPDGDGRGCCRKCRAIGGIHCEGTRGGCDRGSVEEADDEAKTVGADQVVATDDDYAIANLPPLDAVADTVGGRTAEKLIAKVKPGGVFASVVGAPQNAAKYPSVKVVFVFSKFDRKTLEFMAEAVRDGKLVIPISRDPATQ